MGSTRRAFTDEYKAHAVELVIHDGRTIADAARGIEVHEMTLKKWVKKAKKAGQLARYRHVWQTGARRLDDVPHIRKAELPACEVLGGAAVAQSHSGGLRTDAAGGAVAFVAPGGRVKRPRTREEPR